MTYPLSTNSIAILIQSVFIASSLQFTCFSGVQCFGHIPAYFSSFSIESLPALLVTCDSVRGSRHVAHSKLIVMRCGGKLPLVPVTYIIREPSTVPLLKLTSSSVVLSPLAGGVTRFGLAPQVTSAISEAQSMFTGSVNPFIV
jgi:hypothetical protein